MSSLLEKWYGGPPCEHFQSDEFLREFGVCAIGTLVVYLFFSQSGLIDTSKDDNKRKQTRIGYILTTWIAVYTFCAVIIWWYHNWNEDLDVAMYRSDWLGRNACTMQLAYFVIDCLFMHFVYPLTADFQSWFHHIMFFGFMGSALYMDCTNIFLLFFVVELPTAILGIGRMWPSQRRDITFQVTFFLCRIVYHIYLISVLYRTYDSSPMTTAFGGSCASFLLHCSWFYTVISKQYFQKGSGKSMTAEDSSTYRFLSKEDKNAEEKNA